MQALNLQVGFGSTSSRGWTTYDTTTGNLSSSRGSRSPEPDGPCDWLDGEVEEMCAKGRDALDAAS